MAPVGSNEQFTRRKGISIFNTRGQGFITFDERSTAEEVYAMTSIHPSKQLLLTPEGKEVTLDQLIKAAAAGDNFAVVYLFSLARDHNLGKDSHVNRELPLSSLVEHMGRRIDNCRDFLQGYGALESFLSSMHMGRIGRFAAVLSEFGALESIAHVLNESEEYDSLKLANNPHPALEKMRSAVTDSVLSRVAKIRDRMVHLAKMTRTGYELLASLGEPPHSRLQLLEKLGQEVRENAQDPEFIRLSCDPQRFAGVHELIFKEFTSNSYLLLHKLEILMDNALWQISYLRKGEDFVGMCDSLMETIKEARQGFRSHQRIRHEAFWEAIETLSLGSRSTASSVVSSFASVSDDSVAELVAESRDCGKRLESLTSLMGEEYEGMIAKTPKARAVLA